MDKEVAFSQIEPKLCLQACSANSLEVRSSGAEVAAYLLSIMNQHAKQERPGQSQQMKHAHSQVQKKQNTTESASTGLPLGKEIKQKDIIAIIGKQVQAKTEKTSTKMSYKQVFRLICQPLFPNYWQQRQSSRATDQSTPRSSVKPNLESNRDQLISRIQRVTNYLGIGQRVRKICYYKDKIEDVVLSFSEDFQFMAIYLCEKEVMKVYSMKEFMFVDSGWRTTRLIEYINDGYRLDRQLCFSLLFPDRSFDFKAKSREMRDRIVKSIKFMQTCR